MSRADAALVARERAIAKAYRRWLAAKGRWPRRYGPPRPKTGLRPGDVQRKTFNPHTIPMGACGREYYIVKYGKKEIPTHG